MYVQAKYCREVKERVVVIHEVILYEGIEHVEYDICCLNEVWEN